MARYLDSGGREWDATQADDGCPWSGQIVPRGDWMTTGADGKRFVVMAKYFADHYRQVFPRAADRDETQAAVGPRAA